MIVKFPFTWGFHVYYIHYSFPNSSPHMWEFVFNLVFFFQMQYASCLTGGSFDEARMLQNIEACEWLANALRGLEVPHLDRSYANMRAVCILILLPFWSMLIANCYYLYNIALHFRFWWSLIVLWFIQSFSAIFRGKNLKWILFELICSNGVNCPGLYLKIFFNH